MKIGTSNIIKKRKVGKGRKLKMSENQIASVWYIDGNNLKHSNKVIVRLNYNGLDIAVLKEDLNYKAPAQLICELAECRKYGSNMLINRIF